MDVMASQITSLTIVYSTVYSGADQRKHQRSASLAFVRGVHRWPVNSPCKWPVPRKMCPFDDVIMSRLSHCISGDAVKLHHVLHLTSFFFYDVYCLYLHCVLDGEKYNKHIECDGIIERYLHNYIRILLILNGCCHRDFSWGEISHLWICDTQITTQLAPTVSLDPHGLNISENYYS